MDSSSVSDPPHIKSKELGTKEVGLKINEVFTLNILFLKIVKQVDFLRHCFYFAYKTGGSILYYMFQHDNWQCYLDNYLA